MRKWSKETLRSALRRLLIAALLAAAVLLWRETGYLSGPDIWRKTGEHAVTGSSEIQTPVKPAGAARPLAAVVCGADGGRYGAAWDQESVMAVFYRFSADIGEALGSAGTPEVISEEDFAASLSRCGVLLHFSCPQPLELLSAWLGTEMTGAAAPYQTALLCLCTEDSEVSLCFRTDSAAFYRCATAVNPEGLRSRTAEYAPNGAYYAFETPQLAGCDAFTVLLDGAVSAARVQRSVPLPAAMDANLLLQTVGMNSYAASSYREADGTVVYVYEETTLRLSPTGELVFHRSGLPSGTAEQSVTSSVDRAWLLAEQCIGSACGDAALMLAEVRSSESQRSCTVALDYIVNGIPVRLSTGYAAEITLYNGVLMHAKLAFRRYTLTEERDTLLPTLQAAAVAADAQASAELIYADGGEIMSCIWVKSDG